MLKNILNLEGALQLSKTEQKEITGGITPTTGCGVGGYRSNISICVCVSGTWNSTTQTCSSGKYTGNIYENATTCCYSQLGGEF